MSATLLLNADYRPIAVLPPLRALRLLLRERAVEPVYSMDGVIETAAEVRSARQVIEIPSILRLRRYQNVPQRATHWGKHALMVRDRFTCIYCGIAIGDLVKGQAVGRSHFTVDHIIPRADGGKSTWGNTACACILCNRRKGSRTPHQAGMPLLWEPKTPRVGYLVLSGDLPQSWKIYFKTQPRT